MDVIKISDTNLEHARRYGVCPEIHQNDFVFQFVRDSIWKGDTERAVANYFDLGNYSAKLAKEFSDEAARISIESKNPWVPKRILDFAAGYGCVARHLGRYFPESSIASCDIHEQAVAFSNDVLGVTSIISNSNPQMLSLPKQDLIICLSFFSHMPERTYQHWLSALFASLAPNGVLLFTSNGYVTNRKLFPDWETDERGFAFRAMSEQEDLSKDEYGLTIASFPFVTAALRNFKDVRLTRFQEGVWWAVQDVYVCQKKRA